MAQRLDISQINISGILVLILLGALIAAAVIDPPSDNRVPKITAEDRRVTAIHESGHAVLAGNLPAGGHIWRSPSNQAGAFSAASRARQPPTAWAPPSAAPVPWRS